jgi:hypothetical protein
MPLAVELPAAGDDEPMAWDDGRWHLASFTGRCDRLGGFLSEWLVGVRPDLRALPKYDVCMCLLIAHP